MAEENVAHQALGEQAAFQLANVTKTAPQYGALTPRWLVRLLDWKPLEAGTFRRNRVDESKPIDVTCGQVDESALPETYVQYEENPKEHKLSAINAVLNVHTRISDLFSKPYEQTAEQLRILIEHMKERQERELLNNPDYGFLNSVPTEQHIQTRAGAPTPDDLDELLTKVWKEPSFFLAHPRTIAAFGRECTFRGVPPPTDHDFRQFVSDLARRSAGSHRQDPRQERRQQDQDPAAAFRGAKTGMHRTVSAWPCRRSEPRPVGSLHGHQQQGAGLLSGLAILLDVGAHRRCDRGAGRRRRRNLP